MENQPHISTASLKKETVWVYAMQLFGVLGLVQLARAFNFEGALTAIIGALFIFLPMLVLDKRGKPYARYGLILSNPLREIPVILLAIVATWPPIVLTIFLFPSLWQLDVAAWTPAFPSGYVSVLVAHFLVVALPEEFFYRGYLMGRLDDIFTKRITIMGTPIGHALWIQAALFALGHFAVDFHVSRLLVFFPALAFGFLRVKRNNIAAPIIFHGCCNVFMDLFRAGYGL